VSWLFALGTAWNALTDIAGPPADVAHLAGVPESIVTRAESVSKEFFADLQEKLAKRRRSKLTSIAQAGEFHNERM